MKLMLIDDELSILESLKTALRQTGYVCELYQTPVEAVEAYRRGGYDVVITDYMMPGMNGIEVLKAVRGMNSEAYVILLTGYADVENAIAAVNNGAYAFFRKPLNFVEFIDTLRKIDETIRGVRQKEVDMEQFAAEYSRLRGAFDEFEKMIEKIRREGQGGS
jgi:DNA-binding NtrC family response regulator